MLIACHIVFPFLVIIAVVIFLLWCIITKKTEQPTDISTHSNLPTKINDETNPFDISFSALLTDRTGFKLLMKHMIEEYSSEHLYFLIELSQIKHLYQIKHHNTLKLLFRTNITTENKYAIVNIPQAVNNESICSLFFKSDGNVGAQLTIPCQELANNNINHIIYEYNTIKDQMNHLYRKYILTGAEFEVNIDYSQHKRLDEIFEYN
eukprot:769070_1